MAAQFMVEATRDNFPQLVLANSRRGLLAVSETLGADHELVRRHRGELFRLIH